MKRTENRFLDRANQGNTKVVAFLAIAFLAIGGFIFGSFPLSAFRPDGKPLTPGYDLLFFALSMVPFILGWVFLAFGQKYFRQQPVYTLLTGSASVRWGKMTGAFLLGIAYLGLSDLVFYRIDPSQYHFQGIAPEFYGFLLIAVLLFPLQTSFEEAFVRGFLMQAAGNRKYMAIPALVATSVLFGLMHMGNPEVNAYGFWNMLVIYAATGFMLGLFTILSEGLEIAIGYHLANNLYAGMVVTVPGSALATPALFMRDYEPGPDLVWESLLGIATFSVLVVLVFRLFKFNRRIT